jgi:hypothetical protein
MRIVITILAEDAWVLETEAVDVRVGARVVPARERSDVRATAPRYSWGEKAWEMSPVFAARDAANAIVSA